MKKKINKPEYEHKQADWEAVLIVDSPGTGKRWEKIIRLLLQCGRLHYCVGSVFRP